jgi:transcriptional regulator with XRE-family HTH domain
MARTDRPQPGLGQAVRALRERSGVTQEGLASEAGITTGTLSQIETGKSNPSWGTVREIAKCLGAPLEELAGLAETFEERHRSR